jgi:uncharacterized protein (TIGR02466 family)
MLVKYTGSRYASGTSGGGVAERCPAQSNRRAARILAGKAKTDMNGFVVIDAFRTPILMKQWAECDELNRELLAAIRTRMDRSVGVEGSNRGGWHSDDNLVSWEEPCVRELFRQVQEMSTVFVDEIMLLPADTYRFDWRFSAWCVVNRRGDYNVPHNHPSSSWSGVYYVAAEPPPPGKPHAGCIEFQDPRTGIAAARPAAMYGHTWHQVVPRPGLMLMFPGWMTHFVHPYEGQTDRVVISFDAILTDESYDFDKISQARAQGRLGRWVERQRPPERNLEPSLGSGV